MHVNKNVNLKLAHLGGHLRVRHRTYVNKMIESLLNSFASGGAILNAVIEGVKLEGLAIVVLKKVR